MDVKIQVTKKTNCCGDYSTLTIKDISEYLPEDSSNTSGLGNFKKSETSPLTLLYLNKIENPKIVANSFESSIVINTDGYLTLYYIVLPNKQWVDNAAQSLLAQYNKIFYIENGIVKEYTSGTSKDVRNLEELVEYINSPNVITTISYAKSDHFSIDQLYKCYINFCKEIFGNKIISKCNNTKDVEISYKRDLVWMAINVIEYLVKFGQLFEAERIIEKLNSCNGVCGGYKTGGYNGCGCA